MRDEKSLRGTRASMLLLLWSSTSKLQEAKLLRVQGESLHYRRTSSPSREQELTAPTPHTTTPVQQGHSMCPNRSEDWNQFDWALTERPVQSKHQPLQNQGPSYQVNRPKSLTRDDYFLVEVSDEVCWSCFMITQTLRDVLTSGSHYSQQSKGSRMLPTPRGGVQWYASMTVSCTV
jgi:hypothetical protein